MSIWIADKVAELPDLPSLISTILGGQPPIEERSARSISTDVAASYTRASYTRTLDTETVAVLRGGGVILCVIVSFGERWFRG